MPRASFGLSALQGATPGMSRLAFALGNGQNAYDMGADAEGTRQSKMAQALAQIRAAQAQADAHAAKAEQDRAETSVLQGRPAAIDESVALDTGSTLPMVKAVQEFTRTGQRPMKPSVGPPTEAGDEAMPFPLVDDATQSKIAKALARSLVLRTNLKDTKPDDLAKASQLYRENDLGDAIIAGNLDRNRVGGAQAAVAGKDLYKVGGHGEVLDQFTGNLDETGGLARSNIQLTGEKSKTEKAQQANQYASAGQHSASADKARFETQQLREAPKGVLVQTEAGPVFANPRDGRSVPVVNGDGSTLKAPVKPLPEGAQKQLLGARNLQDAIDEYKNRLGTWSNLDMASPDRRADMGRAYNNMMLQAKEAYNLGVLNGPDYDILQSVVKDPTKLGSVLVSNGALGAQAEALRSTAEKIEKNLLESHGKDYVPREKPKPAAAASAPKLKNLATPTSDDEYNALPPGTSYKAPDGTIRTKR